MAVKAKRSEELKYFKEIGDHKVKFKICQTNELLLFVTAIHHVSSQKTLVAC